jgi:hypothetical protein
MIKNTTRRFKNNKIWTRVRVRTLFVADNPSRSVTEDFKSARILCHLPAVKAERISQPAAPALTGLL